MTLKGLQQTIQTMAISILLPLVHLDELGVQEKGLEDGPRRGDTNQTNRIKSASRPTQDKTKTKKLIEFGCGRSDSDDSDAELLGENDDTSYAEAPSDSTYCEGD
jgi:hypothetical protein